MARIGNNTMWNNYKIIFSEKQDPQAQTSTYYRVTMNGTQVVGNDTIADSSSGPNDSTLLGYMMADATGAQSQSQQTTTNPYLTQVFASSNKFVYLYQVSYAAQTVVKALPMKSPITYGQNATIAGKLTDTNGNPLIGGPFTVDIEDSTDNVTFNKVETIPVSQDGSFNYTWTPYAGIYTIRVHFLGVQGVYLESTSDQTLTVNKANVSLTLTASTTNPAAGHNVTFNWRMQPFDSGANITLYYTLDNKTFSKINTFIMTSPSMNYTWTVPFSATFRIWAVFAGDDNYNQATTILAMKSV